MERSHIFWCNFWEQGFGKIPGGLTVFTTRGFWAKKKVSQRGGIFSGEFSQREIKAVLEERNTRKKGVLKDSNRRGLNYSFGRMKSFEEGILSKKQGGLGVFKDVRRGGFRRRGVLTGALTERGGLL